SELGFFLADLDVGVDAIVLFLADERTHLGFAIEGWSDLDLLCFLRHGLHEIPIDRLLHQNAASSRAYFALIDEDSEERPVDGGFKIGVGEKDVGRLSAEFERDSLNSVGGLF